MKYSVLMSVYKKDNPLWLEEAIISILNQTVLTNDFVIVKDGPLTKELDNVLEKYKNQYSNIIKLIQLEKNVGLGLALNQGVINCKNNLIARIDSDDISSPNRIEKQLQVFKENKDIAMVGTLAIEFKDDINNVCSYANFPEKSEDIIKYAKKRNPFCHPSVMFKKESIISAGNYQECYLCEDYDMWIRMIKNNEKFYNIQEYLHYWRVSDDFYKRRSGLKYLKSILSFFKRQYKNMFLSKKEYYSAVIIRTTVYLMPNSLRTFIYKNFLRKKA